MSERSADILGLSEMNCNCCLTEFWCFSIHSNFLIDQRISQVICHDLHYRPYSSPCLGLAILSIYFLYPSIIQMNWRRYGEPLHNSDSPSIHRIEYLLDIETYLCLTDLAIYSLNTYIFVKFQMASTTNTKPTRRRGRKQRKRRFRKKADLIVALHQSSYCRYLYAAVIATYVVIIAMVVQWDGWTAGPPSPQPTPMPNFEANMTMHELEITMRPEEVIEPSFQNATPLVFQDIGPPPTQKPATGSVLDTSPPTQVSVPAPAPLQVAPPPALCPPEQNQWVLRNRTQFRRTWSNPMMRMQCNDDICLVYIASIRFCSHLIMSNRKNIFVNAWIWLWTKEWMFSVEMNNVTKAYTLKIHQYPCMFTLTLLILKRFDVDIKFRCGLRLIFNYF